MDDNLNLYMLVSLVLRLITVLFNFWGVVGVVFSPNASLEDRMFFDSRI